MINLNEFGICNYRLAVKVMSTGKCQCKPKEKCPCPEWIEKLICRCGVFWNLDEKNGNLSNSEEQIITHIVKRLYESPEETKTTKKRVKKNDVQEPKTRSS